MKRFAAACLLATMPLLIAQPASAQGCVCEAAPTFGMGLFDRIDGQPPETVDTTIESADPHAVHDALAAARPAPSRAPVLWCSSASDPRCMPMQPTDAPQLQSIQFAILALPPAVVRVRTHVTETAMTMTPTHGLPAARGVFRSIERPPRG
jgi:hypothetical protein